MPNEIKNEKKKALFDRIFYFRKYSNKKLKENFCLIFVVFLKFNELQQKYL